MSDAAAPTPRRRAERSAKGRTAAGDAAARASLLVELGFEDLPAKTVHQLSKTFACAMERRLVADGFKPTCDEALSEQQFATPRRIACRIDGVLAQLAAQPVERKGPTLAKAYHPDGSPTPAAIGFAKSCGVAVDALQHKDDRLHYQGEKAGASLSERLQQHLGELLEEAPLGARMRWGEHAHRFIRPLRWLLALHGDAPLTIEVMGVHSGTVSYGHRRHRQDCRSAPIAIPSAERYEEVLKSDGKVIVDYDERLEMIADAYKEIFPAMQLGGGEEGWQGVEDVETDQPRHYFVAAIENAYGTECEPFIDSPTTEDALSAVIRQHAASVEFPNAVVGNLDESAIANVPPSFVVKALMKDQQFLLGSDSDNALSDRFLVITDGKAEPSEHTANMYERIAAPKLSDIEFFLQNDRRVGLRACEEELKTLIFYRGLGSVYDKSQRLIQLSDKLSRLIKDSCVFEKQDKHIGNIQTAILTEAARWCKIDGVAETVREHSTLQGEVAGYMIDASTDVEAETRDAVASCVAQHYMPRYTGGRFPRTLEAYVLALADRLDTLVGLFAVGYRPTGSKDPYALRRASTAMAALVIDLQSQNLDMFKMIDIAAQCYQSSQITLPHEHIEAAKMYMLERERRYYLSMLGECPPDLIDAAMAVRPEFFNDCFNRIAALRDSINNKPAVMKRLVVANKRIRNILRQNDEAMQKRGETPADDASQVDESLLGAGAEQAMYGALQNCQGTIMSASMEAYCDALTRMAKGLDAPLTDFFDTVLVMAEEAHIRRNRIALLREVRGLFMRIGDFSKLNIGDDDETVPD